MVSAVTNPASVTMDVPPLLEELKVIQKELSQITQSIKTFLALNLNPKSPASNGKTIIGPAGSSLLADENMQYVIEDCKQFGKAFSHAVNRIIASGIGSLNMVLNRMDGLRNYLHEIRDAVTAWKGGGGGGLLEAVGANVLAEQLNKLLKVVFESGPVQKAIAVVVASLTALSGSIIVIAAILASLVGITFIAGDFKDYVSGKDSHLSPIWDALNLTEEQKKWLLEHWPDDGAKERFKRWGAGTWVRPEYYFDEDKDKTRLGEGETLWDDIKNLGNSLRELYKVMPVFPDYFYDPSGAVTSEPHASTSLSDAYDSRIFNTPRQNASASLPITRQNMFHAENVVINTQSSDPKAIRREIDTWMQRECRLLIENSDSPFIA